VGLPFLRIYIHCLSRDTFYFQFILIGGATSLYDRRENGIIKIKPADIMTANLSRAHIFLTFLVIALGTLVTGSGPHAGDEDSRRFGFDIRTVASIHAEAVIALLGLTLSSLCCRSFQSNT
jgi:heme a synthase